MMYEDEFSARLAKLRFQKGVSSREMSLSIGQNAGYISNIECGKSLPSMSAFFFICEYLGITPSAFFDEESKNPQQLQSLIQDLKKLDAGQLELVSGLVRNLVKDK